MISRSIYKLPCLALLFGAVAADSVAQMSPHAAAAAPQVAAMSVHPEVWPLLPHPPKNPAIEEFVDQLLAQMTLEEKVGQMIQADIGSISPADLRRYQLGSVLAGGGAAPGDKIRTTPQAWLDLADEFYRASLSAQSSGHAAIPILFGIDAVHGHGKIIGATIFPHNVGLGAAHDSDLMVRVAHATAEEVAATGIDWTFAPTVAVVRDVRWGRSYESYSESPQLVAEYAAAVVTGLQGKRDSPQFMTPGHTLASVKHFVGDGGTAAGRDQGETLVPEATLAAVHGAGYTAAIKAGAMIVMASYNSWNGVKMHANHYLLTEILKGRLGFDGFVVGDWNAQEEVPGCTKYRCAAAILAGVDMLMAPDSWRELYKNTLAEVRSGEIPPARIDDAVRRILRVKALAGSFQRPAPKDRADAGNFARLGSPAHRAIAREAVRKSLVLLKNEHATLPLDPGKKILVAGSAADSIAAQCGGWTVDWQGDHNSNQDFPGATSIFEGIRAVAAAAGGSAVLSKDGHFTDKPDAAIVVFGEQPYAEFQGDRENLEFSAGDARELELLRRLRAQGIATVAVFLSGRPMWVNPYINAADAFVAAWLPGTEGGGVADVLLRAAGVPHRDFTGRLAFSWPVTAMPVSFGVDGAVSGALYARGFGLDYEHAGDSGKLSEDARIARGWEGSAGELFRAGRVIAPWSLFVADGGAEVHVTSSMQSSPQGVVRLQLHADGAQATFSGAQDGLVTVSGRAAEVTAPDGGRAALRLRYRVDEAPTQAVMLGVRCVEPSCGAPSGAVRDVTPLFKGKPGHQWRTATVPFACFKPAGTDVSQVTAPFAIQTAGKFQITFAELSVVPAAADARCP